MSSSINLISYMRSLKHLYTVFSADLDAIIASSMLMRIAREEGVDIYVAPFYSASRPLELDSSVVLVKVLQRIAVGGLRIVQLDDILGRDPRIISSITLYLLKELKKSIVVPKYLELVSLIAVASLSRGSIYDSNIIEVHKMLLSETIDKNLYTVVETLKLFGYPKKELVEALTKTVDPYILGISLSYEGSRKLVEDIGGGISSEDAKAKLIHILSSRMSSYCKSCESILGQKIIIKDGHPIDDIYETTYALYTYMDISGLEPLIYICIDSRIIELAKGVYNYMSQLLKQTTDHIIEEGGAKKIIVRGIKVGMIDISSESTIPPLYTIHRILRSLGLTEDITVFTNGKEYLLPLPFIAPKWPYDKDIYIEKNYAIFKSLQDLSEVFK